MEYEKKFVDGTIVEVEVVPKLYLYLFFLWCQLIYFSAGCSHRVQKLPGIRLMGHMRTSSRLKKWRLCHTPTTSAPVLSARENARRVMTSGLHQRKPQLLRLLVLRSGPTSVTLTTQWMSEKSWNFHVQSWPVLLVHYLGRCDEHFVWNQCHVAFVFALISHESGNGAWRRYWMQIRTANQNAQATCAQLFASLPLPTHTSNCEPHPLI